MLPCIIDLEASGFGRGSYPIEVGLCLGDSSSHCFLVRPEEDWQHWDPEAEKVHGISRARRLCAASATCIQQQGNGDNGENTDQT